MSILHKIFSRALESVSLCISKEMRSLSEESNIIGVYNENALITVDENLAVGFELDGVSYGGADNQEESALLLERITFFTKMTETRLSCDIFIKRSKVQLSAQKNNINNIYAEKIISKWERNFSACDTKYILILSTKKKDVQGFLEQQKNKITHDEGSESRLLEIQEGIELVKNYLKNFSPILLSAEEILSFYASHCNMRETRVKCPDGLLRDHYIESDLLFKKSYMIHSQGEEEIFSRILSVKSYDTEEISSLFISKLLSLDIDFIANIHVHGIPTQLVLFKLDHKIKRATQFVVDQLMVLHDEIKTGREAMLYCSFSIIITAPTLKNLESNTQRVKTLFNSFGLAVVQESLALKPLYFSFFPSRANLNPRVRMQTASAISTLLILEKEPAGLSRNSWGETPLTILKSYNAIPYMLNLHVDESSNALGHCLVIGKSGTGKTTFMSFLMSCMHKYDINIFALDKHRGMHNFCCFLNGDYNEIDERFSLNPFSLPRSKENDLFLNNFLKALGGIEEGEYDEIAKIQETLKRLYELSEFSFKDFYDSLERVEGLRVRFKSKLEGVFSSQEDTLKFEKQLSILNMDSILKSPQEAALVAYYLFHKILYTAKSSGKGSFIFVDELKDYLDNPHVAKRILETILEMRKLNGAVALGVQNLDFFDQLDNASSWIDNMAHIAIFPTPSTERLAQYINLSPSEIRFLQNTSPNERKLLWKNNNTKKSIILDVDFSRLGKYMGAFSSNAQDVLKMKSLVDAHPSKWREHYLGDIT